MDYEGRYTEEDTLTSIERDNVRASVDRESVRREDYNDSLNEGWSTCYKCGTSLKAKGLCGFCAGEANG